MKAKNNIGKERTRMSDDAIPESPGRAETLALWGSSCVTRDFALLLLPLLNLPVLSLCCDMTGILFGGARVSSNDAGLVLAESRFCGGAKVLLASSSLIRTFG